MKTREAGLTKNAMISELTRSPHGKLAEYLPTTRAAAAQEPEFLAHLIAWNEKVGQVRDAKVGLPVASLSGTTLAGELAENSFAHVALLSPRDLVRAIKFAREAGWQGRGKSYRRLVERYLRVREENWSWWERTALQHKESLKTLYTSFHVKASALAREIAVEDKAPKGTVFEQVRLLKTMPVVEAAGVIVKRRIPFLVAQGALGARMKEEPLVLAIIEAMSPAELVTNTKMLERLGVKERPALRASYEAGLQRAAQSKKVSTMKTTRAAQAVGGTVGQKLEALQEKQLDSLAVQGNWLVLGDKSGSMQDAIEATRQVAATLARMASGKVHLVFFDTAPRLVDATGKTYEALLAETKHVLANGGTSIGCGLQLALDRGLEVDGIAVVSDSAENNTPYFAQVYGRAVEAWGKAVPVYLYKMRGEATQKLEITMEAAGHDLQIFDLRGGVDYYSLPNLVQTMRTQRFGLVDEIMGVPLRKLDEVFRVRDRGEAA